MAYAQTTDLEARWRPLTTEEVTRATTLLLDAAIRIDATCPPPAEPTEAELRARLIVSCDMVKRAMASGLGPAVTQESQTRGPFTGQRTYANPTGDLYLTKADKKLLGCSVQRAGNVSLLGGDS